MCSGLGLRFGSKAKGRAKILLLAGEVGFSARGGRLGTCKLWRTWVNPQPLGPPCVLTAKGSEALGRC